MNEEIFTRTADVPEPTLFERVRRGFDAYIYAPVSIAMRDWRAALGSSILLLFVLTATIGVRIVPEPSIMDGPTFVPPFQNWAYPLGTDVMGQSIFEMVVHASPAMLKMIMAGSLLSVGLGTFIGTVAGYKGGAVDSVFMTITDVVLTIPGLVLIIVLTAIYDPTDPFVVGLLLGIDNWPRLARTIRSQVLSIREEAFTEASRILGLSQWHILRKDVITNLMPYISVNFANSSRRIIFESVGLYFLGILSVTSSLNWGVMLNTAYNQGNMTDMSQLHWVLVPMFVITLVSLGFILFAQGLDRVFNVRLRARHAKTVGADEGEGESVE
ncbi:ABC transporter permease [Halosimplex marinum]|uniref:ABC transporter permease n=1 Tax=Halosimplex marinum TaxID=3396620 RepID=UPI003F5435AC